MCGRGAGDGVRVESCAEGVARGTASGINVNATRVPPAGGDGDAGWPKPTAAKWAAVDRVSAMAKTRLILFRTAYSAR